MKTCEVYPKPRKKAKYRYKPVPESVMEIVRERSGGICESCHNEVATEPHHIKEKSQGGLNIAINILDVGRLCHNHDDTEFLHKAEGILRERIDKVFPSYFAGFCVSSIQHRLGLDGKTMDKQISKGFLKVTWMDGYKQWFATKEDIIRWLT